jgi:hypothetical protein
MTFTLPRVRPGRDRVWQQVAVPQEVRAAMQDIVKLIDVGDERTRIPADDLIQIGCACGGLWYDDSGRYAFTLYLSGITPYRWWVVLSQKDIEDIARGSMTTLSLWGCMDERCAFKSSDRNSRCPWCDDGADRYANR